MRGIYLDCSIAPYKAEYFFELLKLMKKEGYSFLLLNLGQFFPWSEDFHFRTFFKYPEKMIEKINTKSLEMGISVIPVLETEEKSGFIIREPYYRYIAPGFPENTRIDLGAAGCSKLFEDMIEDLFSLFTESEYIFIKTAKGIGKDGLLFINRIAAFVSVSGRKIIHCITEGLSGDNTPGYTGGFIVENNNSDTGSTEKNIWTLKIGRELEVFIDSIKTGSGFVPSCEWLNIGKKETENYCQEEYIIKKSFEKKIKKHLGIYYDLMEQISLILLNSTMGSVAEVFSKYRTLTESAVSVKTAAEKCISVFSRDFEGGYIKSYYEAALEPVEILTAEAGIEVSRIRKRL